MDNNLFEHIKQESKFSISESLFNEVLQKAEHCKVPAKKFIVEAGRCDTSIYIIEDGLARIAWFDGQKEVTFGFGSIGTIFMSPIGYYGKGEAHYFFQACTECSFYRLSQSTFDALVLKYHEFSNFVLGVALNQFRGCEMKSSVISGTAKDRCGLLVDGTAKSRFRQLSKRPDIMKNVSSKVLASYLGITPAYLSNLRKAIHEEKKNNL